MNTTLVRFLSVMLAAIFSAGCSKTVNTGSVETLFMEKCAMCHPDGGNIMRGTKGLRREDLKKSNIKSTADIVTYIRKPGPDMPGFDAIAIPERDATALAEYILKTFR